MSQLQLQLTLLNNAGITHRDLKPDNVFYVKLPGRAERYLLRIGDFGIAWMDSLGKGNTDSVNFQPRYVPNKNKWYDLSKFSCIVKY